MDSVSRNPYETRVVITGLGTINPLGNNVNEYWDNLIKGKSGVRLVRNTNLGDYKIRIGAEIDLPDITEYFPKQIIQERFDKFIIYSHIAATQAFKDSGLCIDKEPFRYGVIMGTADAGLTTQIKSINQMFEKGIKSISPFYLVSHIPNTCASYFASQFNFQGPNFSVNSACASSNHAIGVAVLLIKMGMADAIISGGSDAVLNEMAFGGFGNLAALSRRNESPETASRPFDKDRDGFIIGEGAGVILLEELEHAKKRGAKIYCELKGFGFSCDAADLVSPDIDGRGAVISMRNSLQDARLNLNEIDLINVHAPSTKLGDQSESNAICNVFKNNYPEILVQSTKSMIGHLIGAAGSTELIAAIMAFERGVIHHTINLYNQDPDIPLTIVKNGPVEKKIKHILSNNFGFGGQNATIIISKYTT
jgi:3-oxoacyl-[acyl-carrier-protein] synthase II